MKSVKSGEIGKIGKIGKIGDFGVKSREIGVSEGRSWGDWGGIGQNGGKSMILAYFWPISGVWEAILGPF